MKISVPAFIEQPASVRSVDASMFDASMTYGELCAGAGIPARVSGDVLGRVVGITTRGFKSEKSVDGRTMMVSVRRFSPENRRDCLYVLAVLAYGFNDYSARESVCGRGLFSVAPPVGRPRSKSARSAAERMRAMRARESG